MRADIMIESFKVCLLDPGIKLCLNGVVVALLSISGAPRVDPNRYATATFAMSQCLRKQGTAAINANIDRQLHLESANQFGHENSLLERTSSAEVTWDLVEDAFHFHGEPSARPRLTKLTHKHHRNSTT